MVLPMLYEINFEMFHVLSSEELNNLLGLLNKKGYPIEVSSRKKFSPELENMFDSKKLRSIDEFFGQLSLLLGATRDYDALRDRIREALNDQEKEPNIRDKVLTFLDSITQLQGFFSYIRLERYKLRASRYYRSVECAIELGGRFKNDFDYDHEPVEDYNPEVVDSVPMVSIQFEAYDSGDVHVMSFSADQEDLDKIISRLLAAQKELRALTKYVDRG